MKQRGLIPSKVGTARTVSSGSGHTRKARRVIMLRVVKHCDSDGGHQHLHHVMQ